jgi:hypothetical protein
MVVADRIDGGGLPVPILHGKPPLHGRASVAATGSAANNAVRVFPAGVGMPAGNPTMHPVAYEGGIATTTHVVHLSAGRCRSRISVFRPSLRFPAIPGSAA